MEYKTIIMIYYTQLIFIKPNCEKEFHAFEDKVLPLLKAYNGDLVYRIRPETDAFIESSRELPYEIHFVTFNSRSDFENYASDPKRLEALEIKNRSVEKIVLIEGFVL